MVAVPLRSRAGSPPRTNVVALALFIVPFGLGVSWSIATTNPVPVIVLGLAGAVAMQSLRVAQQLRGRERIEGELQLLIDARSNRWGITVQSVEMRDVVIPSELPDAMSREAQAAREKQARIILGQAEVEIAHSFEVASWSYHDNPTALHLRAMNRLYEGLKEKGALMLIPSRSRRSAHGRDARAPPTAEAGRWRQTVPTGGNCLRVEDRGDDRRQVILPVSRRDGVVHPRRQRRQHDERLRAGRLEHQPHVFASHGELEHRREIAARHFLAAHRDGAAGVELREQTERVFRRDAEIFAIASTSVRPALIANSIELPNSLKAAARSPRSPRYQTSPVIRASAGRTASNTPEGRRRESSPSHRGTSGAT